RHTIWPRDWSSDVCSSDLSSQANARRSNLPAPNFQPSWTVFGLWCLWTTMVGSSALVSWTVARWLESLGKRFGKISDWQGNEARSEERRVGRECRGGRGVC